jgi:hypothetical protein
MNKNTLASILATTAMLAVGAAALTGTASAAGAVVINTGSTQNSSGYNGSFNAAESATEVRNAQQTIVNSSLLVTAVDGYEGWSTQISWTTKSGKKPSSAGSVTVTNPYSEQCTRPLTGSAAPWTVSGGTVTIGPDASLTAALQQCLDSGTGGLFY